MAQQDVFEYCVNKIADKPEIEGTTLRDSQFKQPLLEFSGACGAAARLLTPSWLPAVRR